MSIDAMRWAFSQTGLRMAEKFVLVVLADRADEADSCFPGIETIVHETCANRKTVMAAIKALEERELISVRRSNGGNRYYLAGVFHRHGDASIGSASSTKNGTSTENGTSPKNGTVSSTKNGTWKSQKRDPNPKKNPKKKETPKPALKFPQGLDEETWQAFLAMRKDMKAPMTTYAEHLALAKLANMDDPKAVVEQSIVHGWKGLFALNDDNHQRQPVAQPSYAKTKPLGA